jgi:hypothetical protein
MRGQTLQISQAFEAGLSPTETDRLNWDFLAGLRGAVPGPSGATPYHTVATVTGHPVTTWPNPQVHTGPSGTWLFYPAGVKKVINTGTWTTSNETVMVHGTVTPAVFNNATGWHVTDYGGGFVVAAGETATLYRNPVNGVWFAFLLLFPRTGCNLWGRSLWGNIQDTGSVWLNYWKTVLPAGVGGAHPWYHDVVLDAQTICWGVPEGGDTLFWFDLGLAGKGYLGTTAGDLDYIRYWEQNRHGFMRADWPVLRLVPHKAGVMVYGSGGIGMLVPWSGPYPTFSYRTILDRGVAGRNAAWGDENEHLFLDQDGELWRVGEDMDLTRLGYRQHLAGMTAPVVTMDQPRREWRICSADRAFVWTHGGLAECPQRVTSMGLVGGLPVGIGDTLDAEAPVFEATTGAYDMGLRRPKTVTGIEIGSPDAADTEVVLRYRSGGGDWIETEPAAPGPDGLVTIHRSAVEVAVKVTADTPVQLSYVAVYWQDGNWNYRSIVG